MGGLVVVLTQDCGKEDTQSSGSPPPRPREACRRARDNRSVDHRLVPVWAVPSAGDGIGVVLCPGETSLHVQSGRQVEHRPVLAGSVTFVRHK